MVGKANPISPTANDSRTALPCPAAPHRPPNGRSAPQPCSPAPIPSQPFATELLLFPFLASSVGVHFPRLAVASGMIWGCTIEKTSSNCTCPPPPSRQGRPPPPQGNAMPRSCQVDGAGAPVVVGSCQGPGCWPTCQVTVLGVR